MTIRQTADYDTLDPYKAISSASYGLNQAVYDRLVWADDQGKILPYLAKSWEVTPTRLEMKVRTDAKCADGKPLTAADMAASLERFVSPATKSPSLSTYLGAGPFAVTSSDDTVTLTTKTPADLLPGISNVEIICPAGLKDPKSLADTPAGSGPYTLTRAQRGEAYTYTLRKDWSWGPKTASAELPQKLVFKVVENDSTAANLLTTGGLDIYEVTGPDAKRLINDSSLTLHPARDFGMTFLQFNQAPGRVTADKEIRRALAAAVDRNAWNKASGTGNGYPSTSMFPTNLECYDESTKDVAPAFDPDAAKAALEEAGWEPDANGILTKDGKPLSIVVSGWEGNLQGPDYVAAALRDIGVKATLAKVDIATQIEDAQKGDFDVLIVDSRSNAPLKTGSIGFLYGPGGKEGINYGYAKNEEAERWMAVAAKSVGAEACEAWGKVQRAFAEEMDAQALISLSFNWFAREGIEFEAVGGILTPWSIKAG